MWLVVKFFVSWLYAIEVMVVAYLFLAYNIDFFQIFFSTLFSSCFLKYFFQTWPDARSYVKVVRKVKLPCDWLVFQIRTNVAQSLLRRHKSTIITQITLVMNIVLCMKTYITGYFFVCKTHTYVRQYQ